MSNEICIVSDSHDNVAAVRRAVVIIRAIAPQLVIHCGDITSPETLAEFAGLPLKAVFGNCDSFRKGLTQKARALGFGEIEDEVVMQIPGASLHVSHGINQRAVRTIAESQEYDYVFIGHTHEKRDEQVGRTRIVNPGALYRAPSYTFARLDPETRTLRYIELSK